MQKHSFHLTRELAALGVDVDVYYHHDAHYPSLLDQASYFGESAGKSISLIRIEPPAKYRFPGHHYLECYLRSCCFLKTLRTRCKDVDFVYAQGFMGWASIRAKRQGLALPPIGVNFHALDPFQPQVSFKQTGVSALWGKALSPLFRANLCHADAALSLGGALDGICRSICGPETAVLLSPNGISPEWVRSQCPEATARRRFIFVGRWGPGKGLHILHQAIRDLSEEGIHLNLDVVGPVPEDRWLHLPEVHYHGLVSEEVEMMAMFDSADIVVCPSLSEGMPTVIFEAMARGLAVIATDVGATRTAVDEDVGWLIPAGDVSALKRSIREAVAISPGELTRKKTLALRKVRSFLWPSVAQITLTGIERFLKDRHQEACRKTY